MPKMNPTPDEIEEACRKIQETWDEETRLARKYDLAKRDVPKGWTPPIINMSEWSGAISEFFENSSLNRNG